MNARVKTAIEHWGFVAPLLQPARNAKDYALLVEALDAAIDAGGADEKHPLARLVDYLGDLVAEYEAKDKMPKAAVELFPATKNVRLFSEIIGDGAPIPTQPSSQLLFQSCLLVPLRQSSSHNSFAG